MDAFCLRKHTQDTAGTEKQVKSSPALGKIIVGCKTQQSERPCSLASLAFGHEYLHLTYTLAPK
jgi:hypothetical protein